MNSLPFANNPYASEILNALTHGVGVILFLVLVPFLIATAVNTGFHRKIIGAIVFSIGLLAVYFSSTIFHAVPEKVSKHILNYFDLLSIYLLISGTYSPFLLIYFKRKFGTFMLILIWALSLVGITLEIVVEQLPTFISLIIYIAMGWIGLFLIKPALLRIRPKVLWLILAGGVSYTLGTYFFYNDAVAYYYHSIWHLFVLGGSLLHFSAVYLAIIDKKRV